MHAHEFETWRRCADILKCRPIFDGIVTGLIDAGMDTPHARDTGAAYIRGFAIERLREYGYGYVLAVGSDAPDARFPWVFHAGKTEKLELPQSVVTTGQTEATAYESGLAVWERKRRSGGGRYS